jgi:Glycosyltransferase WbsX
MQSRGNVSATISKPKALAFYLPQYHPIPENDEWWGRGFTEWHNVTKGRPLFPGHYQPHVPGELGYYDLRVPEVRAAQAELAREHGIHGFVYYHYWFLGRRLLERPFEEVLASGVPDFPFALCWANEEWTRGWDGRSGHVLVRQEFSEEDDRAHIRDLLRAFKDSRYITIDGRPLLLIYRPELLPEIHRTATIWRTEVQRAGFPGLYLCWVESWGGPPGNPKAFGFDASVGFMPLFAEEMHPTHAALRGHRIYDYETAAQEATKLLDCRWKRFPSVMVGWDNTARRPWGATIFHGVTPERYEHWLRVTADSLAHVRAEENYLFLLAWNEWAEGNHLEPDERYGRAFLEATRSVLLNTPPPSGTEPPIVGRPEVSDARASDAAHEPHALDEVVGNLASLLARLPIPPGRQVIDLMDPMTPPQRVTLTSPGLVVVPGTFTDVASLKSTLDDLGQIGAVLLVDVLQHLAEPQQLLTALAKWSRDHGTPPLLITVPHVAHVDVAMQVLCGHFDVHDTGPLGPTNLRFFTEDTLRRLVERSGWRVTGTEDLHSLYSENYDVGLRDGLPPEMVGALQATVEAVNPNWSVTHFVWALEPHVVDIGPSSYGEAVTTAGPPEEFIDPIASAAISEYFASVGLVTSEANRRAADIAATIAANYAAAQRSLSAPKRAMIKFMYSSPRRAAAFKRVYARLR